MRASFNWLKSLLPGLEASPQETAERLTRSGLEIEEIIEYGAGTDVVHIAEVLRYEAHPDRERLKLVTIAHGGGEQTVVCGAPNVPEAGALVAYAPLGTTLPTAGFTIEPRKIGGIVSEGMLCSEAELGLSDSKDGIIVYGKGAHTVGLPLAEAVPATHDWVFEIGITPNRPDALGHIGLARELAALFGLEFEPPGADAPSHVAEGATIEGLAAVTIEDTDRCPHYGAAVLLDVNVARSPDWLRYRLESLGIRAINNVVDITNLVLLEYGHPMHAFDLGRLGGGKIVVRRAREEEPFTTLDGVERKLSADDLVITDGEHPVALAGVMGGADSEIGDSTTSVLLECAYFSPRGIRRASRRHGLHTESSYRFERGCDPEIVPDALTHAASLVSQLCHAKAVAGHILAGVVPAPHKRIELRGPRMRSLLGIDIPIDEATDVLRRLGCEVAQRDAQTLDVVAPSFRPDLQREEDLIEEVMRIHGIDEVPAAARAIVPVAGRSRRSLMDRVRQTLVELGTSEAIPYSFCSPADLAAVKAPEACVKLRNPLSEERSVLRTSLLPGLLEAMTRARRHGVGEARLFSVGSVFLPDAELPDESPQCAVAMFGTRKVGLSKPEPLDVYDAKGLAVQLLLRVTGSEPQVTQGKAAHLHPRARAELAIAGTPVGVFGLLHPDVTDALDLDVAVWVVEIDLRALDEVGRTAAKFRPIPVLPPVTRDLAFVVSEDIAAGDVASAIRQEAGELCESVELFDLFRGEGIAADHRSLAFHLVFRDPKAATDPEHARTLTDKEVDGVSEKVIGAVGKQFGAEVRGA